MGNAWHAYGMGAGKGRVIGTRYTAEYDGKITVVFGTHTHVQTADGRILPHGTGYISDIGMCGENGGVLGMEPESVIYKMRTKMPGKFKPAEGPVVADGVIFTVDPTRGVATAVTPVTL